MKDQPYLFKDIHGVSIPHFEYVEMEPMGVGRNRHLFVDMDRYINHDQDDELHIECCKGLALSNDYKPGTIPGIAPPEEHERIHNNVAWTEVLYNLERYDPTGVHTKAIKEIIETKTPHHAVQSVYKYVYYAMGAAISWYFTCYLKESRFVNKTEEGTITPNAVHFPKLMKYIETLPFKKVGRILFFATFPNAGVLCHKDAPIMEHSDHNINLFFTGGRASYIWDPIKKVKHYLNPNTKSYFFNNRDFHGVDPDPVFRYTLRIDGTFTDELCEHLGLEDGYTWKWDYMKEQK